MHVGGCVEGYSVNIDSPCNSYATVSKSGVVRVSATRNGHASGVKAFILFVKRTTHLPACEVARVDESVGAVACLLLLVCSRGCFHGEGPAVSGLDVCAVKITKPHTHTTRPSAQPMHAPCGPFLRGQWANHSKARACAAHAVGCSAGFLI